MLSLEYGVFGELVFTGKDLGNGRLIRNVLRVFDRYSGVSKKRKIYLMILFLILFFGFVTAFYYLAKPMFRVDEIDFEVIDNEVLVRIKGESDKNIPLRIVYPSGKEISLNATSFDGSFIVRFKALEEGMYKVFVINPYNEKVF